MTREAVARHDGREMSGYLSPPSRPLSPGAESTKSSRSLHKLGLENYPYPVMPEGQGNSQLSRTEEKQSLQHLNNRLAGYIDKVRSLQTENSRLSQEIRRRDDFQSTEVTSVKVVYDQEIDSLKTALQGISQQYNQLRVASDGLMVENEEMRGNIMRRDAEISESNAELAALQREAAELATELRVREAEGRRAEEQLAQTAPEVQLLRQQLAELRRLLDEQQLEKADMEDQMRRLQEEMKFKMELCEQQMEEVRGRREVEITQLDGKLQDEYESRLARALEELRGVYDNQMDRSRQEFAAMYDVRVTELQTELGREKERASVSERAAADSRARLQALTTRLSNLESENLELNQQVGELGRALGQEAAAYQAQVSAKEQELRRLQEELRQQGDQYTRLLDTKVALDMEIAVFRRLLETEEDRLGMEGRSGH